jgi:hypothetical protein
MQLRWEQCMHTLLASNGYMGDRLANKTDRHACNSVHLMSTNSQDHSGAAQRSASRVTQPKRQICAGCSISTCLTLRMWLLYCTPCCNRWCAI